MTSISIGCSLFIGLLSCALGTTAYAGELIVHSFSRHSKYNRDVTTTAPVWQEYQWVDSASTIQAYNNRNYGLGWRTDSGLIFGAYRNSYYRLTAYVGQEYMLNSHVGGFIGLATGYKHSVLSPVGGFILKIPLTERSSLKFMGTPETGRIDGVVHMTISYRF